MAAIGICSILFGSLNGLSAQAQNPVPSPYDAFGGKSAIARVVERGVENVLKDERIKARFARTNLKRLRSLLAEQFCDLLDGPCTYSGRDMIETHQHLKLSLLEFNALVEDFQAAMDAESIPFSSQSALIAKLAPTKREIVYDPKIDPISGNNSPSEAK
jgi:hemoglobin